MALALGAVSLRAAEDEGARRILLRSSWQTVNIGDIAHTPGMLWVENQNASWEIKCQPPLLGWGMMPPKPPALLRRRPMVAMARWNMLRNMDGLGMSIFRIS